MKRYFCFVGVMFAAAPADFLTPRDEWFFPAIDDYRADRGLVTLHESEITTP